MPSTSGSSAAIGLRLALAFVAVAVVAVVFVAGLAALFGEQDLNKLVQQRRDDLIHSLQVDAASTYNTGKPGWSDVDLKPALELAASTGTRLAVLDMAGNVVASTIPDPLQAEGVTRQPIRLHGSRIGTLLVQFTPHGLASSADNLKASLVRAVVGAAGLAAVLALLMALITSRRITRPVTRLVDASRAIARGARQARAGPITAPGQLQDLVETFDRMADTLIREEQIRRDLVADVAHELRTPIAVLQASCEALMDQVVEPTPEQIGSFRDEVLRLSRMVDDLQTLASAEAAALHLTLSPCDLGAVADGAADALTAKFESAGLSLDRHVVPTLVKADPARLHQIITNLLTNALKFTAAPGQVRIDVSADGEAARLSVSDTGVGIPETDQPHVFERFWRSPQSAEIAGSGIGLAVVAELVRAHNGHIQLASTPGAGTTVTVTLPLADGDVEA